jgi:hypothetical protein
MAKPEGQDESRLFLYGETLPELPPAERLAAVWSELGYAKEGMAGAVPLDWSELEAFARLTDCDLNPHEASCLMDMSRAYCVEVANRNPLRKSPMERAE